MTGTVRNRKVKVKGPNARLKRALLEKGVTYHDVASRASVSWHMVWAVLNKRKVSDRVLRAAQELAEGVAAA